jgi:hypothetical protein
MINEASANLPNWENPVSRPPGKRRILELPGGGKEAVGGRAAPAGGAGTGGMAANRRMAGGGDPVAAAWAAAAAARGFDTPGEEEEGQVGARPVPYLNTSVNGFVR